MRLYRRAGALCVLLVMVGAEQAYAVPAEPTIGFDASQVEVVTGGFPAAPAALPEHVAVALDQARLAAQRHPADLAPPYADAAGRIVLPHVTEHGARVVEAAKTVKAARSQSALERIKRELISRDHGGLPGASGIYSASIDARRNRVLLETSAVTDALLHGLRERYGPAAVAVIVTPGVSGGHTTAGNRLSDTAPYHGGARTVSEATGLLCTSGFSWRDGQLHHMLSAGHCLAGGGFLKSAAPGQPRIGWTVYENWDDRTGTTDRHGDLAMVRVYNDASAPRAYVGGTGSADSRPVVGKLSHRSNPGDQFCTGGSFSGEICGWTVSRTADWTYDDGTTVRAAVIGTKTGACTTGGDSGGPVYIVRPDGTLVAKGVISGGRSNAFGCTVIFSDIWDAYYQLAGDIARDDTVCVQSPDKSAVYRYNGRVDSWTRIGGAAKNIYGGNSGVYAVHPTNSNILSYNGTPDSWSTIGGPGSHFVVGSTLYGLAPDKSSVHQHLGGQTWQQIGGAAGNFYAGGYGLFATNPANGDIHRYNGSPDNWTRIGGPGAQFAVSNDALYALAPDRSAVMRYNGSPDSWTQIGGPAARIYAGGYGFFATNPATGDISRYNGSPGNWTRIGGPGASFVVSNNALYGLAPDGSSIAIFNGTPDSWTRVGLAATNLRFCPY